MDDTSPATKGDVRQLENRMHALEQRIDERFDRMHEDIDRILNILVITKEATDDHETRITKLEATIA